jgi:diguanylate cyclase (GGDEF)-like protein
MSSHDFVDASRQQLIDEASKEVGLDALTGLGNRRLLEQYRAEFEHTVSEESPLSIAIIDIDSFKKVNDTYGHAAGDAVLVFFANKMKTSFRKDDVLIRWGGEEFLIFLRRTGVKDASVLMENLRRGMQETPIDVEGVPIQILITIGLKEHRPLIPLEESIKRSDELMYQGKLQGGNCVVW